MVRAKGYWAALGLISALLPASLSASTPPTDLLYGHFETHLEYTQSSGWRTSVSYDTDGDFNTPTGVVRLDPAQTRFVLAPSCRTTVPNLSDFTTRFGPAGSPIWVLPQDFKTGQVYLGVRAVVSPGVFQTEVLGSFRPTGQGTIALELLSVTGTGPAQGGRFAVWKTEGFGTTVFPFDTSNSITAADRIGTIPVTSHTHYHWGFTRPGTYDVRMRVSGRLLTGGTPSAEVTYRFVVPFSSRIGSGAELRIAGGANGPECLLADAANHVAYATDRAMLEASTAATPATTALRPGAQWEMNLGLSSIAQSLANGVGVPATLSQSAPAAAAGSNLALQILSVRGPGSFALIDGSQLLPSGPGSAVPLSLGASRALRAAFTATGIYRIQAQARQTAASGAVLTSAPCTLTFGAGLTADFTYAQWASSFERSANWAAGTLANRQADPDRDGLSNAVEFAWFWHGLDPTQADAQLMPQPTRSPSGATQFSYLRDTFKDPLDETRWIVEPEFSTDLRQWQRRSSRVPGFPLELTETGAEEGNACGAILRRTLRPPVETNPMRAFYRFGIIPSNAF